MPYHCAERLALALNDVQKPVSGSSVLILGVAYKGGVGDLRESPALKVMELLEAQGARSRTTTPSCPGSRSTASTSSRSRYRRGARRGGHRGRRHRPSGRRPRARRRGRTARDRLPKRRSRGRWASRKAVSEPVRVGMAGLGRLGAAPAAQLRHASRVRPAVVLRPERPTRAPQAAALPERAAHDQLRRPARRRRARGGRARNARADPPRAGATGARGRKARVRREADDVQRRRGPRAARRRPAAGARSWSATCCGTTRRS